ncbi:MAG TPA: ABC transporter permease [Cyclobacteriaceae bacterium]|nr:ABC transporter permease [Cyclobacteriaceae bacterium]
MLTNYLKTALRTLLRNRFYSLINIFGLALGLSCVFLIVQYLKLELSYDRFHEQAEDIYRIAWEDENPQTRTPHPMAQALVQDFPEVESAVSITPLWGVGLTRETYSFRNPENDIRYDERNVMAVDTTFFDVFTFPLIKGNPEKVLKNTGGLLISASMAKKYFGNDDPIGKQLSVNDDSELIEVVGVFQDVPQASHFHFDFLVSYLGEKAHEDPLSQYFTWNDFGHYNYVRLKPGTDAKQLEGKLTDWVRKYIDVSDETFRSIRERNFGFRLQPLTDIHLHSHLRWELEPNGYITYVYMMTAAAVLILIIACVNFINLTTAQSAERTKEIGIRKSLGAFRNQLVIQFTGESLLVSGAAMVLSIVFIELARPFFTEVTGHPMEMNYWAFALVLGAMGLFTGIIAGAFPSLYLASAKPGLILKGALTRNNKGVGFRQGFIVFQFFASMILISSSVVIYNQLNYIQHKELGFDKEEVVVIPVKNYRAILPKFDDLRNELLKVPGIKAVSASSNIPGRSFNQNPVYSTSDPQSRIASSEAMVDYDFFGVMGIELAEGRTFQRENPADREAFIINETAARNLYQGSAVGKEFSWDYDEGLIKGTVIGVVKDFNFQSLHEPVRPLLFRLMPRYNFVLVKLNTEDFSGTIKSIERTWKKFDDRFGFEFSFLDSYLQQQYSLEQNMASVLGAFSFIAVAIACFGLLGIAVLTFKQRTKEVSIRKVLGANVLGLILLLIKDFTRIVLIAVVLAVPLVWWMMSDWLQNFTFRISINPLVFAGSGMLLMAIAWGTLSYLTVRVAQVNPAETLKME